MIEGRAGVEAACAAYRPLVRATARRYLGRGAEFEDLEQEGYLALIRLLPRCPPGEPLPRFLKLRLPAMVRDAAERMRRDATMDVCELEGTDAEPCCPPEEIGESPVCERLLSGEDLHIVRWFAEGWTQADIGRRLGISQQAVSARLRRIRPLLRPVLFE